ncbi:MAG: hypothetical protein SF051_08855, partial [Elusimicrobiota bacterium]|nr:hypothetical protein [Elusimicrobiota bacterium]
PVTAARKLTELEQVLSAYPGVTIKELSAAAAQARAQLNAEQSRALQASMERHRDALGSLNEIDGVAVAAAPLGSRRSGLSRWTGARETTARQAVSRPLSAMDPGEGSRGPVSDGPVSRVARAVAGAFAAFAGFIGGAAASLAAIGGLAGLVLLAAQVPLAPAMAGAGLAAAALGAALIVAANLKSHRGESISDALSPSRNDAPSRAGFLAGLSLGWIGVKGVAWVGLAYGAVAGAALFFVGAPAAGVAVLATVAAGVTAIWLSFNANTAVEMIKSTLGFVPSYLVMAAAIAGLFALAIMGGLALAPALAAQLAATVGAFAVPGASAAGLAAAAAAAAALGSVVLGVAAFSPRPISEMLGNEDDFNGFKGGAHRAARYAWTSALVVSAMALIGAGLIGALLLPSTVGMALLGATGVATLGLWARSSPYSLGMTASAIATFLVATAAAVGAFVGAWMLAAAAFPAFPVSAGIAAVGALSAALMGALYLTQRLRDADLLDELGNTGPGALAHGAGLGAAGAAFITMMASVAGLVALGGLALTLAISGGMGIPLAAVGPSVAIGITAAAVGAGFVYMAIYHPRLLLALVFFNMLSSSND